MQDEVTVTLEVTVRPETAEVFSQMGNEGLRATGDFPGCREVRVVRHQNDSCRFLFIERWDDEASYRNYIEWRTERGEYQAMQAMATKIETNIWPQLIAAT